MKSRPASMIATMCRKKNVRRKRPDMSAVHVGVRHEDDLVVAELGEIELLGPMPRAQGRDEGAGFPDARGPCRSAPSPR